MLDNLWIEFSGPFRHLLETAVFDIDHFWKSMDGEARRCRRDVGDPFQRHHLPYFRGRLQGAGRVRLAGLGAFCVPKQGIGESRKKGFAVSSVESPETRDSQR